MAQELTLFSSIESSQQRFEVLQRLISAQQVVVLKSDKEDLVELKASGISSNGDLQLHCANGLPFKSNTTTTCSASFEGAGEKYLLEGRVLINESLVTFKIDSFFQLQRRKNYRYKVPKQTKAIFQFKSLNHKPVQFKAIITDLSNEGFSALIGIDEVSLNSFDKISGTIALDDIQPIAVIGQVKNLRLYGESQLTLGIQFDHHSESSENIIIELITHLQRKAFRNNAA